MSVLDNLLQGFLKGSLNNSPQMRQAQQMLSGKSPQQKAQTILNLAQSMNYDINAKNISADVLRRFGIDPSSVKSDFSP